MGQRFVYRPLSPEQTAVIGNLVIADVLARIKKGVNSSDTAAKPLKPGKNGKRGYPERKAARGLQGIRDLVWRGLTMRSIRVISATSNEIRIGFDNPQAAKIAAINQAREPMFWFSAANKAKIGELVRAALNSVGRKAA